MTRLADGASAAGCGFSLRRLGRWGHGRVPVEQASATVAREQLPRAKLVPRLRAHAHAASGALLIVDAGQSGAAACRNTVEAHEPLRFDGLAQDIALGLQHGLLAAEFLLAICDALAGFVERHGQLLHLRARRCQCGLLPFGALQAGIFFVLKPFDLQLGEPYLVFNGLGLRWSLHRVQLSAEVGSFLAMSVDLAIHAGAQRVLAAQRGRSLGCLPLYLGQRGLGLDKFGGQCSRRLRQARPLQICILQLYEVFNVRLHPCIAVYAIYRPFRKSRRCADAAHASNQKVGVAKVKATFLRRHKVLVWLAGILLAALVVLAVVVAVSARRAEPYLRARIVEALSAHFHTRVELDSFHLSFGNGLRGEWGVWADGRGLRIWPPAQVAGVGVPGAMQPGDPLIRLAEFRFHAPLRYKPGAPVHITQVRLEGLDIHLPPRSHFLHLTGSAASAGGPPGAGASAPLVTFQLDRIECNGAQLVLEPGKPDKLPMEIAIAHLRLTGITAQGAMIFDAELTNPRPVGTIHSTGRFGPWQVDDPGESPVMGDYHFDHADLASFAGIAGILTSTGHYQGTLRDIVVDGETNTPDFQLPQFGNPTALRTRFHAIVDGTDGDTRLDPVDATLGRSRFTVQGQIVRVLAAEAGSPPHSIGHDIALAVSVDQDHIEDFIHLASHASAPLLTGNVTVKATLHIPPGSDPIRKRMTMHGSFLLEQTQFTSAKIQDRIRELSLRGQGRPGEVKSADPFDIQAQIQGDFQMAHGIIDLPNLNFTVPGADIQLKGTYALDGGALDFVGVARMQATVSKMVGGWKGFLLKPADRFFKKSGAGADIPIHIGGTGASPDIGIDFHAKPATRPESPAQKQ